MMLLQASKIVDTATSAGLTLVESGALGAVTVIAIAVAIWAISKLNKVQDMRVNDQKRMNTKAEALLEKMLTVFGDMKNSLENLTVEEREAQKTLERLNLTITQNFSGSVVGATLEEDKLTRGKRFG